MNVKSLSKIFVSKLVGERFFPLQVIFSVTSRCNSKCKTCGIWKEQVKKDLSPRVVEVALKDLDYSLLWVVLSGGEPSLHPCLDKIIRIILSANVSSISLVTNGFLPRYWSELIRSVSSDFTSVKTNLNISVSIDGLPEIHDDIRGIKGAFANAWESFRLLLRLSEEKPWLNVFLNYTISSYNVGHFSEFLDFISAYKGKLVLSKVNLVLEQFSLYYGEHQDKQEVFYQRDRDLIIKDVELYEQVVLSAKREMAGGFLSKIGLIGENFFVRGIKQYLVDPGILIPLCAAGVSGIYIDYNGRIYPCSQYLNPIGYIDESGVKIDKATLLKRRKDLLSGNCGGCWVPCEVFISWFKRFPLVKGKL